MDDESKKIITEMKLIYGKDVSVYDEAFLLKSIERRCIETKAVNSADYARNLVNDRFEAEKLYNSLHINFSRFFRDPVTFSILEQRVFPGMIANKRDGSEIRIWSAGCANGQEAYSIAMLLSDFADVNGKDIRFRIFATDISRDSLSMGEIGIYDERMVDEVKTKHLRKYFTRKDNNYAVIPELKKHIRFSLHDLLDQSTASLPDSIYGDFDMVICSNVLIYYKDEIQQHIIKKLQNAISQAGFLVTDETEKSMVQDTTKLQMVTTAAPIFQNNKRR
ncbi:MAG: CheR family methyltransferase [Saccharofermentanales bacterium]